MHHDVDLILYTTDGCHLCDLATQVIASVVDLNTVVVELVDIAEEPNSDELIAEYGVRIPVVRSVSNGREIGWPFDASTFNDWFQSLQS